MKVSGLSAKSCPSDSGASLPENFARHGPPRASSTRRSTTTNPTLCRVEAYLTPGLPRPTTRITLWIRLCRLCPQGRALLHLVLEPPHPVRPERRGPHPPTPGLHPVPERSLPRAALSRSPPQPRFDRL